MRIEKENNNNFCCVKSPSVRPSFYEVLKDVKIQIDYECFGRSVTDSQLDEICLIIAEVLLMNPDNEIKINGEILNIYLVQEIYKKISNEHIELVIENFENTTTLIRNKKAYLRTALYNSVFEYDSHYTNLVRHDLGV